MIFFSESFFFFKFQIRTCPNLSEFSGQIRTNSDKSGFRMSPHDMQHRYISQYLLGRHQNQYWIRSRSPRRVSEPLLLSLFTVGDFSDKFGQIRTCPESRLSETLMLRKKISKNNFFHICKYFFYSGSQKRFF